MNKNFNYWKLSKRHKKRFILHHTILVILLLGALTTSWFIADVSLPDNVSKLTAGSGFVVSIIVFLMAVLNRASSLFKIKSIGFFIFFLLFLSIQGIIEVLVWSTGLMTIILIIDDFVMTSIWNNIWYNQYED